MQLGYTAPACDDRALEQEFAAAMARLGPFGPAPRLALAVSGGADSMALAVLAQRWAATNNASVLTLIVDHGLRAAAAGEAALTAARLGGLGIRSEILTLSCAPGPALQARARLARHRALAEAARAAGSIFLLFGHHAADQAETVAMRTARAGVHASAVGMAGWMARRDVLLLRPLLGLAPERLKALLRGRGIDWIEDPSNADPRFERSRLRAGGALSAVADAATRQTADRQTALFLAWHVTIRPEGFASVAAESAPASALAALLRVIGGGDYAPAQAAVAALASRLKPATLGGVQIARSRNCWLLVREFAACAPPAPAMAGEIWDRRFRLRASGLSGTMIGATIGALGDDAPAYRGAARLPALVARSMPCLRLPGGGIVFPAPAVFTPPAPAASHPFFT